MPYTDVLRGDSVVAQSPWWRKRFMGINAITHNDDGEELIPTTSEEWDEWVSASRTRAYILGDTLTDWLGHHGEAKGFVRDDQLDGYDERLIFPPFIMGQGNRFRSRCRTLSGREQRHAEDRPGV